MDVDQVQVVGEEENLPLMVGVVQNALRAPWWRCRPGRARSRAGRRSHVHGALTSPVPRCETRHAWSYHKPPLARRAEVFGHALEDDLLHLHRPSCFSNLRSSRRGEREPRTCPTGARPTNTRATSYAARACSISLSIAADRWGCRGALLVLVAIVVILARKMKKRPGQPAVKAIDRPTRARARSLRPIRDLR